MKRQFLSNIFGKRLGNAVNAYEISIQKNELHISLATTKNNNMPKYKPRFPGSGTGTGKSVQYAGAGFSQGKTQIVRPAPTKLKRNFKSMAFVGGLILISNLFTLGLSKVSFGSSSPAGIPASPVESLYLMDKARIHVQDEDNFERKVREIASMLEVAPEWLMSVMYSESKFDASVKNYKGSGATGLIQFMPAAASDMGISLARLARMDHLQQLEYVYLYLQTVRDRYGEFNSLADLYLAILYPKALNQDYCYTLYASPSQSYKQNSGLDENKDGRVTVSDVDRRMQRLYPTAYVAPKPGQQLDS